MLIERKSSGTYRNPRSLLGREGILGEPVSLIKERAEVGFPITSLPRYENSGNNTLLSTCKKLHPTSETIQYFSNPYDDLELDLHKLNYTRPNDDFVSKQKYEGVVLSISDSTFIARLHNLSENIADEEAEFSIEELNNDDIPLLKKGAVFYWNIGYLICYKGYKIACHLINFRRLPVWTKNEIEESDKRAKALFSWLSNEDD